MKKINKVFNSNKIKFIYKFNLTQAGVRYSLINLNSYIKNNLVGFHNIIFNCVKNKVKHFIYASTSSVYGMNKKMPFKESDNVDHPIQLCHGNKRSN